ncbi:hypothetical protein [Pseudomonas sp.]|uniref:hypothetical protein n=1 Tax=Pseudomonas sp. TaxID=306 RepID=UPI002609B8A7|nr:hypothetical protein [Pseudomonas sp.]
MMMERKVKLSAKQPEGDRNGLTQQDALEALTVGFASGAKHLAVVELEVVEQATGSEGVLTNRVALSRIELIAEGNAEHAASLLREAYEARQHETLDGLGGEDIAGRGNE